jgi:hypothetical protein
LDKEMRPGTGVSRPATFDELADLIAVVLFLL